MDSALRTQSPDKPDTKPSFRKPSNDAVNRKYRRHSPVGGLDSSSSDGSPKHDRSRSPVYSRKDCTRIFDDRQRKDDGSELERHSSRSHSSRGSDLHRHSDKYGSSHDYHRHDDYSRYHRHADEEERSYQRSSQLGRESRSGSHSDHRRRESNSDRSNENYRNMDKNSRDKSDNGGYRSKDKERETLDKDSDKAFSESRPLNSSKYVTVTGERDRHKDKGSRDDKRDRLRSPGDHKNDRESSYVGLRGQEKDSTFCRDVGALHLKETHKSRNREMDGQKEDMAQKMKHNDRDSNKRKDKYTREPEEEVENESRSLSKYQERDGRHERYSNKTNYMTEDQDSSGKKLKHDHSEDGQLLSKSLANAGDERPPSSSKQVKDTATKVTSEPINSTTNQAEAALDINAAKVAAMKAAELVNRNLVGGGLSTDQKKKLLWGNKKNSAAEEAGNRWDLQLFADRERQEKFNKLMGVKGDVNPEQKPNDKDGSLHAEKQKELQMDLEKQYTAGLRRRDGRTVGLGL